jgi:hypothetical protein
MLAINPLRTRITACRGVPSRRRIFAKMLGRRVDEGTDAPWRHAPMRLYGVNAGGGYRKFRQHDPQRAAAPFVVRVPSRMHDNDQAALSPPPNVNPARATVHSNYFVAEDGSDVRSRSIANTVNVNATKAAPAASNGSLSSAMPRSRARPPSAAPMALPRLNALMLRVDARLGATRAR